MLLILGQQKEINNLENQNLIVKLSEYIQKKPTIKKPFQQS